MVNKQYELLHSQKRPPDLRIVLYGFLVYLLSSAFLYILIGILGFGLKAYPVRSILSIFITILWLLYYIRRRTDISLSNLGLNFNNMVKNICIALGVGLFFVGFGYIVDLLYSYLNLKPLTMISPNIFVLSLLKSGANINLIFFDYVLISPAFEELYFRGITFTVLKQLYGRNIALIVSSVIFALSHIEPIYYPFYFIVGIALVLIYEWRKNLLLNFIAHSINNLVFLFLIVGNSNNSL